MFQIAVGGLSAAALGKWSMKVGTRATMMLGGALFGTAFAVSGAGVAMHSLPLLYAGNILTKRLATDIICSFNKMFLRVLNQRYVIEKD